MKLFVVLGWIGTANLAASQSYLQEPCPEKCSALFGKLETTPFGEQVQDIVINQRGEPKSGTSFMFEWGQGSLIHACDFLQSLYGRWSCQTMWEGTATFKLLFEPKHPRVEPARCPCTDVDRVTASLSMLLKHTLPVLPSCPWQHMKGVAGPWNPMPVRKGRQAQNFYELQNEILTSGPECARTQAQPQMVVLRDPRPMAVSAYYFTKIHDWQMVEQETVDEFVLKIFPSMCQWLAIRYVLFQELMADYSTVYWYDESLADPLLWHGQWHTSLGFQFPHSVLAETTDAAVNRRFNFPTKGRDPHPGGAAAKPNRTFEQEVSAETLAAFDEIMRTWLPSVYLDRFGVKF